MQALEHTDSFARPPTPAARGTRAAFPALAPFSEAAYGGGALPLRRARAALAPLPAVPAAAAILAAAAARAIRGARRLTGRGSAALRSPMRAAPPRLRPKTNPEAAPPPQTGGGRPCGGPSAAPPGDV